MGFLFSRKKKQTVTLNQEDQALLDCKVCRDKIKRYIKSLEKNAQQKREKAKEALKNKDKDRAKMNLRMAKMYSEQIKAADGQLEMIENQITQIETAQSTRDAMSVLKQGNEILKKLQSEVNVEKFQEIADDMEDVKEQQNEITEFFKNHGLDADKEDEEVGAELENLLASIQKEEGLDLPSANKEELTNDNEKEKSKNEEQKVAVEA